VNFLANPFRNLVPLFTDAAWTKHANTAVSADGKTLTLTAAGSFETSYIQSIAVTPNTVYAISFTGNGRIKVSDAYGTTALPGLDYPGGNVFTFNTGNRTAIKINLSNAALGAGTFTFANLSLTKVQPMASFGSNPFANLVPLFSDAAWTRHANATPSADGKTLTLNASAANQISRAVILVSPNTKIRLTADVTVSGGGTATINLAESANAIPDSSGIIKDNAISIPANGSYTVEITTRSRTAYVQVQLLNSTTGTYTFSNLKLEKVQPAVGTYRNPFAELVTNGDFSQGATGWTLSQYASVVNGRLEIAGNVSAFGQEAIQDVAVTPLTTYSYRADVSGSAAYLQFLQYDANSQYLGSLKDLTANSAGNVITHPRCTRIRIKMARSDTVAGTAWFDNVSLKRKQP
jgi:hypothetical protein